MKKIITLLLLLTLYNCLSDETKKIPFIEGYWEIVSVTKDQIKIKDFKISPNLFPKCAKSRRWTNDHYKLKQVQS